VFEKEMNALHHHQLAVSLPDVRVPCFCGSGRKPQYEDGHRKSMLPLHGRMLSRWAGEEYCGGKDPRKHGTPSSEFAAFDIEPGGGCFGASLLFRFALVTAIALYLVFCHGCHRDQDNELFVRVGCSQATGLSESE
jgi:hypothetical protein